MKPEEVKTPNFDLALKLSMAAGILSVFVNVYQIVGFRTKNSLEGIIASTILSILITFGTLVFGLWFLVLGFLGDKFKKPGDPFGSFLLCHF